MNAGICCICTAVIFYLHFFVYGRMLLDNPVAVGAICFIFAASMVLVLCIVGAFLRPNQLTSPTITPFPQTRMAKNTVFLFLIFAGPLTRNKNKEFNLYGIQNYRKTGRLGAQARRI